MRYSTRKPTAAEAAAGITLVHINPEWVESDEEVVCLDALIDNGYGPNEDGVYGYGDSLQAAYADARSQLNQENVVIEVK